MNLTKLTLVSCPVILAALVMVSSPAEASTPANLLQPDSVVVIPNHHTITTAVASPSDAPSLPIGCSFAQCTQANQLLQGKIPGF
jgi:hypothetical protein